MSQTYQRRLAPDATRMTRAEMAVSSVRASSSAIQRLALVLIIAMLLWGVLRVVSLAHANMAGAKPAPSPSTQTLGRIALALASNPSALALQQAAGAASVASLQVAGAASVAPPQASGAIALAPIQVGVTTAQAVQQIASPTALAALQAITPTVGAPAQVVPPVVAAPVTSTNQTALDQAWKANDWPQVIALAGPMMKSSPGDKSLKDKLFSAHYNYGVQLVRSEHLAEAVAEFDKALAIKPNDAHALGERKYAQLYLEGSTALNKGDFAAAITPLRTIYIGNTAYRSVKTRLYQAYVGYAAALEKSGKKDEAYLNYQKASTIDVQGSEAKAGMARCKGAASTTAATGKKIEVDIAKQQVTVWENDKVVWRFTVSTGESPWLTRKGNFKILDKMPNAYSSGLKWGMPYWMGIYYAGKEENGFHALARDDGGVMSDSVLGKPKTHGCVMLSDSDAKNLYDWTEIGTAVWIH